MTPPPVPFPNCDYSVLTDLIVQVFYKLWNSSFDHSLSTHFLHIQHQKFRSFALNLLQCTKLHPSIPLTGLLFIHRIINRNPSFRPTAAAGSEYRFFIVSVILASKKLLDNAYTNKSFSVVTGINATELSIMELEFLKAVNYDLYVSVDEWKDWLEEIRTWIGRAEEFSSFQLESRFALRTPTGSPEPVVDLLPSPIHSPVLPVNPTPSVPTTQSTVFIAPVPRRPSPIQMFTNQPHPSQNQPSFLTVPCPQYAVHSYRYHMDGCGIQKTTMPVQVTQSIKCNPFVRNQFFP
ncbi:cyclin-domain-containing protein [Paraphysoderma sedebokerense]|nr:cyclin-domain-containing protein [Paraphysoderma sedebokerense]